MEGFGTDGLLVLVLVYVDPTFGSWAVTLVWRYEHDLFRGRFYSIPVSI